MRPLRDKRIYQQVSEAQRLPEPFIRYKDAADINQAHAWQRADITFPRQESLYRIID